MRNTFLCTTALVLASGVSASAMDMGGKDVEAGSLSLGVGGYFEVLAGFANVGGPTVVGQDLDGLDFKQDVEIHFSPTMTLDNGLTIGAHVELEGSSGTPDTIDEAYMTLSGNFGKFILGSENSVGYKMTVAAPDVTHINVNSGSTTAFIPFSGTAGTAGVSVGSDIFRGTLGTTYLENRRNNDAQRISYFSPDFSGFSFGVSYARDGAQDSNGQLDCNAITCDFIDLAVAYSGSLGGGVDVALSGRWGTASAPAGALDPEVWGVGANVSFGNITIGGSYAEQKDTGANAQDGESYDFGIAFANGPWSYSLTYFHGENDDNENYIAIGAANPTEELDQILLGATYRFNSNFAMGGYIADVDFDEQVSDGGAGTGDDVDGTIVGISMRLDF